MSTSFKIKKFFEYLNFNENKLCQAWMSSLTPDEIKELTNNQTKFDDIVIESEKILKRIKIKSKPLNNIF